LPVTAVFVALTALGMRVGELWNSDRVVDFEMDHPGETLFLRKILQDNTNYKYKKLIKVKPDVVVLGSSRVMQFRQEMFGPETGDGVSFYNGGGLSDTPLDMQNVLDLLPTDYKPKIIFIGLDSFEFGKHRPPGGGLKARIENAESLSFIKNWKSYIYASRYLALDIIGNPERFDDFWEHKEPVEGKTAIGILALKGNGFRSDGSFQYGAYIFSHRLNSKFVDAEDPPIIERIREGTGRFAADSAFDEERAATLKKFLISAKEKNIFVAGFAPPYSSEAFGELISSPHQNKLFNKFRKEVPAVFKEAGFPFFDFSDPSSFGINDQYMFDGFHPTETTAAVMLRSMLSDPRMKNAPLPDLKSMVKCLNSRLNSEFAKPFEINWK